MLFYLYLNMSILITLTGVEATYLQSVFVVHLSKIMSLLCCSLINVGISWPF